jgi:hypothetical protein
MWFDDMCFARAGSWWHCCPMWLDPEVVVLNWGCNVLEKRWNTFCMSLQHAVLLSMGRTCRWEMILVAGSYLLLVNLRVLLSMTDLQFWNALVAAVLTLIIPIPSYCAIALHLKRQYPSVWLLLWPSGWGGCSEFCDLTVILLGLGCPVSLFAVGRSFLYRSTILRTEILRFLFVSFIFYLLWLSFY